MCITSDPSANRIGSWTAKDLELASIEKEIKDENDEIMKLESDSAKTESSSVVVFLAQK